MPHAPTPTVFQMKFSRGAMRGVFFLLIGKRAFGERSHHAIEPLIHQARDEILLMHARFLALSRSFLQAWLRGRVADLARRSRGSFIVIF